MKVVSPPVLFSLRPLASVADLIISKLDNERVKRKPIKLSFKEGLALLNGTQFMSAYGLYCVVEARKLYHLSNLIASISLEAFSCRKEGDGDSQNPLP